MILFLTIAGRTCGLACLVLAGFAVAQIAVLGAAWAAFFKTLTGAALSFLMASLLGHARKHRQEIEKKETR